MSTQTHTSCVASARSAVPSPPPEASCNTARDVNQPCSYCNLQCSQADWAKHKLVCATIRETNECSFAAHKAQGGGKKNYKLSARDVYKWYAEVPGLRHEIELLAWNHRGDMPLIDLSASLSDVDGSGA